MKRAHLTDNQFKDALRGDAGADCFEHLAECSTCRDELFLRTANARTVAANSKYRLIGVAAVLILAALPFTRVRQSLPTIDAGTTPSLHRLRPREQRDITILQPIRFAPRRDQFVVRTSSGERWISFQAMKMFRD